MWRHLDMRPSCVDKVAVLIKLVLDADGDFCTGHAHLLIQSLRSSTRTTLLQLTPYHRQPRAIEKTSLTIPVNRRVAKNDFIIAFSLAFLSTPSTRNQVCIAFDRSCG